ncbi:DUF4328 domain-containing protein [Phycicoccus avicenniae]|uniref:DUF4328 domain-containing protein n=1 Tax=Phycicoccus avicenniae TaxID=2828860 RepID=UPI003D2E2272
MSTGESTTTGDRAATLRPAGWYTDPEDATRLRRWDGRGWTDSWMPNRAATGTATPAMPSFGSGTPAGWHTDPAGGRSSRYWDGTRWTDRVRPGVVHRGRSPLGPGFFTLAAWLRGLLVLAGVVSGLTGLGSVWTAQVLARWSDDLSTATLAEGERIDSLTLVGGLVDGGATLVTGVVFIVWLFRAYGSDRVDPARLTHGRGWTIGAWFTPVIGFWRPRRLVLDLWEGARSGTPREGADPLGRRLDLWWGSYLVMNTLAWVSTRVWLDADLEADPQAGVDALLFSTVLDVLSALAAVVAAWFALTVVREVTDALRRPESSHPVPEAATA